MTNNVKLYKTKVIKIPKTVEVLYCKKKKLLVFKGFLKTKSLTINNKIAYIPSKNSVLISSFVTNSCSKTELKNAVLMQGTYLAMIKAILIEINYDLYRKLNFVGVGYRAFFLENFTNQLYLKLGFSHLIYFKIPQPMNAYCIKFTRLFIFGNVSVKMINHTLASLRQCKKPEPYKGKGILYEGERIKLKKGKKI